MPNRYLATFHPKSLLKNTKCLLFRILEHGSCKLYKISNDKNEYKRIQRTLTGSNKMSDLDEELINDTLMDEALRKLSGSKEVHLIHDPSDIRKPYSNKSENLGKVRDLKGKIINGYSSHNIVAITPQSKEVHFLSHELYSNKDEKFLKAELVHKLESDKEFTGQEAAQTLYESNDWFNKKTLTKDRIKKVSDQLKKAQAEINITHILDREFDDDDYFGEIVSQGDDFVIRVKKSRSAPEQDQSGKKIKLINSNFDYQHIKKIQKIRFKKAVYQDASLNIEWRDYNNYTAVKITAKDRNGKDIFKDPMLLITSRSVKTAEDAMMIYDIYMKRSRIEAVFKFLKDGLGWEEMQLQDFQAIQKLLSFCFFIAAYLYEVGDQQAYDDYAIVLADLGGGKGIVSRHYIHNGIKNLLMKYRVDRFFERHKTSEDTIEIMLATAGYDL